MSQTEPEIPVLLDVDDRGVATVSLNRPKLNIYNLDMRDGLIEAFTAVRDHPDARVLVIRANGPHFSAGADLSEFGTAETIHEARRIRWDRDPWGPLWELPQPVIVALRGYSVGSGFEMSMLCDIRLANHDAKLSLPETRLGMLPSAGGTQSLTRVIGPDAALPIVATSLTYEADEALRLGLVHEVVDDVDAAADELASRLAMLDRRVVRAARRALHAAGDLPLDVGLRYERRLAESLADLR